MSEHETDRIKELWVYIAIEPCGCEAIPAMNAGGAWLPMVGADKERTDSLRLFAEKVARETGHRIELRKYTTVEVVDVIDGKTKH